MSPRALDVLTRHMRGITHAGCQALAASAGLSPALGMSARSRASFHHVIDANAYLGLCAAAGIDPMSGKVVKPRCRQFAIEWSLLGAGFIVKRSDTSLRAIAPRVGVSFCTLSRLESGLRLSVESMLAVCAFMGVHPEHYALVRDVPRETTPNTLNPKEAA